MTSAQVFSKFRTRLGIHQQVLADELFVARSRLSSIERGKTDPPLYIILRARTLALKAAPDLVSEFDLLFGGGPYTRFAMYFRLVREAANWAQIEMADYLGNSQSCVSKIEAGFLEPSASDLLKIKRLSKKLRRAS